VARNTASAWPPRSGTPWACRTRWAWTVSNFAPVYFSSPRLKHQHSQQDAPWVGNLSTPSPPTPAVLVHGDPERSDMVEYFGGHLAGFVFTKAGWVQSYGSRCVRPPIIAADVSRAAPMAVHEFELAQAVTAKPGSRGCSQASGRGPAPTRRRALDRFFYPPAGYSARGPDGLLQL